MTERITRARLERIQRASSAVASEPDPVAMQALRSKLDSMRERLLTSHDGEGKALLRRDPGELMRQVERTLNDVFAARDRLEELLANPEAPDHVVDAGLRDLRIARLRALLADLVAEDHRGRAVEVGATLTVTR